MRKVVFDSFSTFFELPRVPQYQWDFVIVVSNIVLNIIKVALLFLPDKAASSQLPQKGILIEVSLLRRPH